MTFKGIADSFLMLGAYQRAFFIYRLYCIFALAFCRRFCKFFKGAQKDVGNAVGKNGFMSNKAKILVVEDELQLAFLMTNVLTRIGCDVETVCTGKKAMELATQKRFDLITLDIQLPDANGLDLCTKLKQRHISRKTPVIFISASPVEKDISEGMKRGAVDYITKPFDITDFIYRVIYYARASQQSEASMETQA
jgi:CheY-like chemotaxis protein